MKHNYYSIKFRNGALVRFRYLCLAIVLAFIAIPPLQGMAADSRPGHEQYQLTELTEGSEALLERKAGDSYLSKDPQLNETDGSEVAQRTIYGRITDRNGDPLPGVNIVLMGTNIGTVSDADGYYEINISDEDTLIFSMIGFQSREVNSRSLSDDEYNLVMSEQTVGLEELVVLGYSEVQSQHVASSVSTIDIERVRSGPVAKLQEVFKGTLPGVNLMQGSNLPGQVPGNIQIRGISTLQSSAPLVIVDGMEQSLTDIDPNQVRSITVLKDAASASMYGSRGANGVILIETERGISDRFSVDVHTWTAMHNPIDHPDFVGSADFMMLRNEARSIQGQSLQYTQQEID